MRRVRLVVCRSVSNGLHTSCPVLPLFQKNYKIIKLEFLFIRQIPFTREIEQTFQKKIEKHNVTDIFWIFLFFHKFSPLFFFDLVDTEMSLFFFFSNSFRNKSSGNIRAPCNYLCNFTYTQPLTEMFLFVQSHSHVSVMPSPQTTHMNKSRAYITSSFTQLRLLHIYPYLSYMFSE